MKGLHWESVIERDQRSAQGPVFKSTERAKVPGGWLVRESALTVTMLPPAPPKPGVMTGGGVTQVHLPAVAITFFPDPNHEWGKG